MEGRLEIGSPPPTWDRAECFPLEAVPKASEAGFIPPNRCVTQPRSRRIIGSRRPIRGSTGPCEDCRGDGHTPQRRATRYSSACRLRPCLRARVRAGSSTECRRYSNVRPRGRGQRGRHVGGQHHPLKYWRALSVGWGLSEVKSSCSSENRPARAAIRPPPAAQSSASPLQPLFLRRRVAE